MDVAPVVLPFKIQNSKFWSFPTVLFMTNSKLTSLKPFFVLVGGFECANPGKWLTLLWAELKFSLKNTLLVEEFY